MRNFLFALSIITIWATTMSAQTTSGDASFYAPNMNGKFTSTGEKYDHQGLTCANGEFPVGTILRVTRVDNSHSVDVRVNDCVAPDSERIIVLSGAAAKQIGLLSDGVTKVNLSIVKMGEGELACGRSAESTPASYDVVANRPKPASQQVPSISIKGEGTFQANALQPIQSGFGVQIGSYVDYGNATEAAANLQAKGFTKVLIRVKDNSHQLILGPFDTQPAAEVYRRNLKANYQINGFVTQI